MKFWGDVRMFGRAKPTKPPPMPRNHFNYELFMIDEENPFKI